MKQLFTGTIGRTKEVSKKADVTGLFDPPPNETQTADGSGTTTPSIPLTEMDELKKKEYAQKLHAERQLALANKAAEKRNKALEAMQYEKVNYDPEELKYFVETPSQISKHLYIGTYECIKNKKDLKFKYKITHIINCTTKENLHASHFHYLTLPNKDDPLIRENFNLDQGNAASLRNPLQNFFESLEKITKENGVLLVASDDGTGASFIIAYLIKFRKLAFFESFQFVSERRYTLTIEPGYIEQLLTFEDENYDGKHQNFQCPCGENQWTLLSPFVNKPTRCGCDEFDSSFCPNLGCGEFCKAMLAQKQWKWTERVLRWGYTHRDNVLFIASRTEEFNPIYNLDPADARKVKPKAWTVYRCRRCLSLTHAISNNDMTQWALVTN